MNSTSTPTIHAKNSFYFRLFLPLLLSVDLTRTRGRDCCKSKGWRITDIRKDVASGKNANRDGFQDLKAAIDNEKVGVVIVYRLDRLSRNVRDIYDFLDLIARHNVALVSLCESLDTTTAMGRAMLGVMAVFAQLTREMIAENVKDGMMRRAQAGLYIGSKRGPMGYVCNPEEKTLTVVEHEAETVRRIFELFVERKWGIEKIVGFLNETGIPSKTGVNWHKSIMGKILRNPIYIGRLRWHDEVYEATHEPIISEEIFQAAQDIISSRATLPGRSHQSQHLLSGLAECGVCGKRLVAHYGRAKKSGERHVFYFHRVSTVGVGCKSFYKSAPMLEKTVVDQIRKAAESDMFSKIALDQLHKQTETKSAPLKSRNETIHSELATMKDKFNSWADRLDRGLIDEDQFAQQNRRLMQRKHELQDELVQIDSQLAECENVEISFEAARKALQEFPQVWDILEIEEKRELVRLLVEKLEVHKDHLLVKIAFLEEQRLPL
ncbi:MAG: recombinase family protein, partial [Armatimonadota bacterium]